MEGNAGDTGERRRGAARTNAVVFGSRDEEMTLAQAALARYLPGCRLARESEQQRNKRRVRREKTPVPSLAELKKHFGMPPIPPPSNPEPAPLVRIYEVVRHGQAGEETRTVAIAYVSTDVGPEGHVIGIEN